MQAIYGNWLERRCLVDRQLAGSPVDGGAGRNDEARVRRASALKIEDCGGAAHTAVEIFKRTLVRSANRTSASAMNNDVRPNCQRLKAARFDIRRNPTRNAPLPGLKLAPLAMTQPMYLEARSLKCAGDMPPQESSRAGD